MNRSDSANKSENVSYMFIPFTYKKAEDFLPFVNEAKISPNWNLVKDDFKYLLKYVAEKLNSDDEKNCQCFHFRLNADSRNKFGLLTDSDVFSTKEFLYKEEKEEFTFRITNVDFFCFSTTVGIISFEFEFCKNDPLWISSAQFNMKRVSRTQIKSEKGEPFTFLQLAENLMQEFSKSDYFEFFYFSNFSKERANFLTCMQSEDITKAKEDLFFLKRCYSDGFLYSENEEIDKKEYFSLTKDVQWGISTEAVVCLTYPDLGRREFLEKTFFYNFKTQYLFTYVLLLHQKYVLYMFLSNIGIGTYNDIDMLEKYKNNLYEFETDFVFSCITEVPQYQELYARIADVFGLKKMYEDVHEPILSLADVRRSASEKKEKKRDDIINTVLFFLAIIGTFSVIIDVIEFVDAYKNFFMGNIKIISIVFGSVIAFCFIGIMIWRNLRKKN